MKKGDKIRVTEVRENWIGGYVQLKGQQHLGWIRRVDVTLDARLPDADTPILRPTRRTRLRPSPRCGNAASSSN